MECRGLLHKALRKYDTCGGVAMAMAMALRQLHQSYANDVKTPLDAETQRGRRKHFQERHVKEYDCIVHTQALLAYNYRDINLFPVSGSLDLNMTCDVIF